MSNENHVDQSWDKIRSDLAQVSGLDPLIFQNLFERVQGDRDKAIKRISKLSDTEIAAETRTQHATFVWHYSWAVKLLRAAYRTARHEGRYEVSKSILTRFIRARSAEMASSKIRRRSKHLPTKMPRSGIPGNDESMIRVEKALEDFKMHQNRVADYFHDEANRDSRPFKMASEIIIDRANKAKRNALRKYIRGLSFSRWQHSLFRLYRLIWRHFMIVFLGFLILTYSIGLATKGISWTTISIQLASYTFRISAEVMGFLFALTIFLVKKYFLNPRVDAFIRRKDRQNLMRIVIATYGTLFVIGGTALVFKEYFVPQDLLKNRGAENVDEILETIIGEVVLED